MKKILIIASLFLIPFFSFSQTTKPIEGFLGIKFGSSPDEVTAAIKAKGGKLVTNNAGGIFFEGVKLGQRVTTNFYVSFVQNKAYQAVFFFKADADSKTILYYNALVSDISEIYGKGKSNKIFRSGYQDGDGYEVSAIEQGDADYFTDWVSSPGSIQVTINKELSVVVFYQDTKLTAAKEAENKTKAKADF